MSNCSSGCVAKDHASYAACLRSKRVATTGLESTGPGFSKTTQKKWDTELDLYASARKQGVQPSSTKLPDIRRALDASDAMGAAYNADQ